MRRRHTIWPGLSDHNQDQVFQAVKGMILLAVFLLAWPIRLCYADAAALATSCCAAGVVPSSLLCSSVRPLSLVTEFRLIPGNGTLLR